MGKHLKIRTVVLGFMLICVCGCGRSREAAVGPTVIKEPVYQWGNVSGRTISVWGRESDLSRSYITRAFERYEELTGNTVNEMCIRDSSRAPCFSSLLSVIPGQNSSTR